MIETKTVALGDLTFDPDNARLHPDKNLESIRKSLERFGQVEPLVVQRGTNVVIGGNGRLEAMRQMNDVAGGDVPWPSAQVVYVDLNEQERKALGVALNRTGELAKWDHEKLGEILIEVQGMTDGLDTEALIESMSFSDKEMEKLINVASHVRGEPGGGDPVLNDDLTYSVIVDFPDEHQQAELLNELEGKGHSCRLLIS